MSAHETRAAEFVATIRFHAQIPADDGLADDWADRISARLADLVNAQWHFGVYDESTNVVDLDEVVTVGGDE